MTQWQLVYVAPTGAHTSTTYRFLNCMNVDLLSDLVTRHARCYDFDKPQGAEKGH